MAKKTVAGYRDKSKSKAFTKIVRAVKNTKTGNYSYKEEIIPGDMLSEYLKENVK